MNQKLTAAVAAILITLSGLSITATAADAADSPSAKRLVTERDSGWGCGGAC